MITRLLIFGSGCAVLTVALTLGGTPIASAQHPRAGQPAPTSQLVSVGRLIRSGQARNGTPRFALLDKQGSVTAYVVPAAGLNLARHVNQRVAVTARRVSRDHDGIEYLLAQRVSLVAERATAAPQAESWDELSDMAVDEPRIVGDLDEEAEEFERLTAAVADGQPVDDASLSHSLAWGSGVGPRRSVRSAAHYEFADEAGAEELLPEPENEVLEMPPNTTTTGCGNPSCASCAPCGPSRTACCPCGPAGRYWFRVDFLGWNSKQMDTPPLVTTSTPGTSAQDAGVLGLDSTDLVTGGIDSDSLSRSGVRFLLGGWFDPGHRRGLEVDYYFLDEETESHGYSSIGDPILARPFFNSQLNMQDSELVAYPGIVSGTVEVSQSTEFYSFAPRYRHNLTCRNFFPALPCGGCGACGTCGAMGYGPLGGSRVDLTLGYRWSKLDEGLYISEDLISTADSSFATFELYDAFETSNEFSGFELGLVWDVYRGRWSMEAASRFSVGNNTRKVAIHGATTSVSQGAVFSDVGGLLALPSNIGVYEDDQFVVIPEFSLTLGYQIAPRVRLLVGYMLLYWNNVVRPGDQIDLNVNPDLLPPAIDTDGMLVPSFAMRDTTFWAQGINLGLDWRW